ncbi:MAG: hypothetical protein AAF821_18905 [Cyanobacteria bacterium P01_D01_bin.156]
MSKFFSKLLGRKQNENTTVKDSTPAVTKDIQDSEADKVSGGLGYASWW